MKKIILSVLTALILGAGCSHESPEYVFPDPAPDPGVQMAGQLFAI